MINRGIGLVCFIAVDMSWSKVWLYLLLLMPVRTVAQFTSWDDFVYQLLMDVDGDEVDATLAENLYDDYMYWHAHPININQADSVELQQLGFLTDRQIEGIHYYIYRYGALHGVGELMLIPELDYHTRQLLSYMVTFGEVAEQQLTPRETWHQMLTQGRSELSTRVDVPLYMRAGYVPRTQSQLDAAPSRYYVGSALYQNLRYNYRYGNKLSWGFSAEKDAGEPAFIAAYPLPDFLSGYVQLNDMGVLKTLVVGNYRLRFGQGLVMNSDFALGKTMLMQSLGRQSVAVKPHRGTGEADYYSGAAATVGWGNVQFTAYASYRQFDATLDGVAIKTLKTDGYHRTPLELARKDNTLGNLFGVHLAYASHGFHVGTTAQYQSFNRNIASSTLPYKRYAPQGHSFFNASVDYAWHHHRVSVAGETAVDGKGAVATLNMLRVKAVDGLFVTLLQRHYTHDYWALEGKSFAASSDVRNERGIYLGADWQPFYRLQFTAYADVYRFPFLRYRVSEPSCGVDGMATARYIISDDHSVQLRYRYHMKQRDVAEGYKLLQGTLFNEHTHRLRLRWEGVLTPLFNCQATAEGCLVQAETLSTGGAISLQMTYSPLVEQHVWRISGGGTAFHTDYATRIYGYERGLLYAYNYHMCYGTGWRGFLYVQYVHKAAPRLTCTAKLGATRYLDREIISSGAAMIAANHCEDLQLQLRYTF